MKKLKLNRKAFTLVEMLVVLVVVAILMAIIIPNISGQRENITEKSKANLAEVIKTQEETYRLVDGDQNPVTTNLLQGEGYLTNRQVQQATDLLNLGPDEPIPSQFSLE